MGKKKRPTRTTPRRPRRAPVPLTAEQDRRYSLLRQKGVDQVTIAETLAGRGVHVTRQTVGAVILNRFVNDDVITVFCELTDSTRAEAWPDVPEVDTTASPDTSGDAPAPRTGTRG